MNYSKFVLILKLATLFILFATGCDKKADSQRLRVQLTAEPVSLDFSKAEDGLSMKIFAALMSGITRTDANQKLQNEMAEKIEIFNNGLKFRITLKPWKWSDGKECTAQDYLYGFKRTLDPKTVSKLSDLLFFIKNALPYKQGKIKDFTQVGIIALNSRTLEFNLESAFLFFPNILSLSITFPQREDLVEKWGDRWTDHMLTTGPYQLKKWEHDKKIILEKNVYYPEELNKGFNQIEMLMVHEDQTAVQLFENNQLDVLFRIPTLDLKRFQEKNHAQEFSMFATFYLGFNQKIKPWQYRFARAAVAQSIDRDEIVKALGGVDIASSSWVPNGITGANAKIGLKYDPEKAKSEWKKLSPSQQSDASAFVLGFDSGSRNQLILEMIQSQLQKNLGTKFNLVNQDWKSYVSQLSIQAPPIFRFGFLSVFADAFAHLFLFESGNPNNYTGWKSAEFDQLLHGLASSSSNRNKYIDQAQKLILEDDVVVVPIFQYRSIVGISNRITGFNLNGLGLIDFRMIQTNP